MHCTISLILWYECFKSKNQALRGLSSCNKVDATIQEWLSLEVFKWWSSSMVVKLHKRKRLLVLHLFYNNNFKFGLQFAYTSITQCITSVLHSMSLGIVRLYTCEHQVSSEAGQGNLIPNNPMRTSCENFHLRMITNKQTNNIHTLH